MLLFNQSKREEISNEKGNFKTVFKLHNRFYTIRIERKMAGKRTLVFEN